MAIEFGCRTSAARILLFCVPLLLHNPAEALLSEPYCPLFNCGGVNITYPFWVLPSTPAINATFCGYRDLNLTCDSHNASKPTLRTSFGNYTVKNFNGTVRTVALLNRVAGDDHCPIVQHNFTLQGAGVRELQYGQEVLNLTFFYNCSEKISTEIPEEHHIRCFSGGGNLSYVFIDTAVNPTYSELYSKCQPPLIAPVMRSLVDGKTLSKAFPEALKEGFQLKSMHEAFDNCEWCERSQGYCGGNDRMAVDSDFFCFCEDGQKVPGNCTTRVPTGVEEEQLHCRQAPQRRQWRKVENDVDWPHKLLHVYELFVPLPQMMSALL